jgi:hypothetical protein
LLEKHAREGEISSSEQYILTGYLAKYLDYAEEDPTLLIDPFDISARLEQNSRKKSTQYA